MIDCLVVGGVSPIGRALTVVLRRSGLQVATASRRTNREPGCYFFDLETLDGLSFLPRARHVAIVAAETKFAACEADPERTARINSAAPEAIARWARSSRARTLFFSSIAVFDGSVDKPQELDEPTPNSVYGAQKATAEVALQDISDQIAILRPGKVIDGGFGLWRNWLTALGAENTIEPFDDMLVAPVFVDRLVEVAAAILTGREGGVFHYSAADNLTYADIARRLCKLVGADPDLVRPVSAKERLGPATLWLPKSARLDCRHTLKETGIAPPRAIEAVNAFFEVQKGLPD